jgi:hypothetical protein
MTLIANMSRRLLDEYNVDTPAGSKLTSAYDAALYEEMGKPSRGVLVITVICNLDFKDGPGQAWTAAGKADFASKLRDTCAAGWGEKHRITTTSSVPAVNDVGVILDVKAAQGGLSHSHWNVKAIKVAAAQTSGTWDPKLFRNGRVELDSLDFDPEDKNGPAKQVPALHEFGHMLGHLDEYPTRSGTGNLNWLDDKEAVMNLGSTIRERHYAMFAAWLTKQYKLMAPKEKIVWKVNGRTDLFDAKL